MSEKRVELASPIDFIRHQLLGKLGIVFGLAILVFAFAMMSPVFISSGNLSNILVQSAVNAIIAAGMTFVVICGQIDLSVGATLALSTCIGAKVMVKTGNVMLGVVVTLAAGIVLGVINGVIVAYIDFPPFITTLSTMWLFRGVAYVYTGGQAITNLPDGMMSLAMNSFLRIPLIVWLLILVYVICHIFLSQSGAGRKIYAVGDNPEASRLTGINVKGVKLLVFTLSGFLAALSGVILMSRLNSGQPIAGQSFEMYAIAAAVIGGASLTKGGIGNMPGTIIGAVFIATLQNGLTILNVSSFWQQVFMGIVVLFAIGLDKLRKRASF